ncbi:MAG TPA: flagellar basal body protein [Candidatus Nanoarchaeia archaeon]|nr:flagellar basal body protein [Candidatus Nanoarchaeia archaeon]
MIDSPMMQTLGRYLDIAAARHSVVTGNIANVDTPGYRTRDVDFASELGKAHGNPEDIGVYEVGDLVERPDGNNVDIDRESLALAETQLRFRTATELLKAEFRRYVLAINEGR